MMELPKRHATSLYGQPVRTHKEFGMKGGHGLALLVIRVIYLSLDWLSGQVE
jgi:hypothetical protein